MTREQYAEWKRRPKPRSAEEMPSRTEDAVVELIRSRGVVGRRKYGTTMDRRDLTPVQWAQHLQEELADGLKYAERYKNLLLLLEDAKALMEGAAGAGGRQGKEAAEDWLARYNSQVDPDNAG